MVVAIKFSSLDGFEEGSLRVSSADSTEREPGSGLSATLTQVTWWSDLFDYR